MRRLVLRSRGFHRLLCTLRLHAWETWMERWGGGNGELKQGWDYLQCAVCGKRRRQ